LPAARAKAAHLWGEFVGPVFDMETANGAVHVFDQIRIGDLQIKTIHAFYDPEQPPEDQASYPTILNQLTHSNSGMH
jgi:hypothetical protein